MGYRTNDGGRSGYRETKAIGGAVWRLVLSVEGAPVFPVQRPVLEGSGGYLFRESRPTPSARASSSRPSAQFGRLDLSSSPTRR